MTILSFKWLFSALSDYSQLLIDYSQFLVDHSHFCGYFAVFYELILSLVIDYSKHCKILSVSHIYAFSFEFSCFSRLILSQTGNWFENDAKPLICELNPTFFSVDDNIRKTIVVICWQCPSSRSMNDIHKRKF